MSTGRVEQTIIRKLTESFQPIHLEVKNERLVILNHQHIYSVIQQHFVLNIQVE